MPVKTGLLTCSKCVSGRSQTYGFCDLSQPHTNFQLITAHQLTQPGQKRGLSHFYTENRYLPNPLLPRYREATENSSTGERSPTHLGNLRLHFSSFTPDFLCRQGPHQRQLSQAKARRNNVSGIIGGLIKSERKVISDETDDESTAGFAFLRMMRFFQLEKIENSQTNS
ncbi:hypothetical protein BDZ45DRAFT_741705 [Acephala macrosclerotiorum]|nr:hypothetical protein BDZ45DRAFT_741705 [Acephala macrosclerotiorum]